MDFIEHITKVGSLLMRYKAFIIWEIPNKFLTGIEDHLEDRKRYIEYKINIVKRKTKQKRKVKQKECNEHRKK